MLTLLLVVASAAPAFEKTATYVDETGATVGERWVHRKGATLDLFERDTAPQMAVWIPTPPTNDRGASHALEHLLTQRGPAAAAVMDGEGLWGVRRTAFTQREYTGYLFRASHSTAGFYAHLGRWLEALMRLRFDEQDLRAEIVQTSGETASGRMFLELQKSYWAGRERIQGVERLVYGEDHPLGRIAGGHPNQIHELTARDIRAVHRARYTQDALSLIVVVPDTADALAQIDGILRRLPTRRGKQTPLPPPRPAAQGAAFSPDGEWLPTHHLVLPPRPTRNNRERLLLQSLVDFEETYAPDDVRVQGTEVIFWGKQASDPDGEPLPLSILSIASLEPDSPDLAAWRATAVSRAEGRRRDAQAIAHSAPNLGGAGVQKEFIELLRNLAVDGESVRVLTQTDDYDWLVERLSDEDHNPWQELIATESLDAPQIVVETPKPAERAFRPAARTPAPWEPPPLVVDPGQLARALATAPMDRDPTLGSESITHRGVDVEVLADAHRAEPEVRFIFDLRGIPGDHLEWTGLAVEIWKRSLDPAYVRTSIHSATGRAELVVRARGEDQLELGQSAGWRPRRNWTAEQLLEHLQPLLKKKPRALRSPLRDLRSSDDPRLLHARSRTVKRFDLLRLKWRLTAPDPELAKAVSHWTPDGEPLPDASLDADLRWMHAALPEATASSDLVALKALFASELSVEPASAVARFGLVLDALATRDHARATVLARDPTQLLPAVKDAIAAMPAAPPASEAAAPRRLPLRFPVPPRHTLRTSADRSRFRFVAQLDASDEAWIGLSSAMGHSQESLYGALRHSGVAYGSSLEVDPLEGEVMWKASRCADLVETVHQGVAVAEHPVSVGAWGAAITRQMVTRRHEKLVDRLQHRASARKEGLGPDVQRARRERWKALASSEPHDRSLLKALIPSDSSRKMYSYVQASAQALEKWVAYLEEVGQPAPVRVTERDLWIWDAP